MENETQECSKCHKEKPMEDFPINFAHQYKRLRTCKICMNKIWDKKGWGLGEVDRKNFHGGNGDHGIFC